MIWNKLTIICTSVDEFPISLLRIEIFSNTILSHNVSIKICTLPLLLKVPHVHICEHLVQQMDQLGCKAVTIYHLTNILPMHSGFAECKDEALLFTLNISFINYRICQFVVAMIFLINHCKTDKVKKSIWLMRISRKIVVWFQLTCYFYLFYNI